MVDVIAILHELERAWEAGSLPGRQSAELNSALRELHRLLLEDYYLRHCDLLHIAPNESGISFCPSTNIGQDSKLEEVFAMPSIAMLAAQTHEAITISFGTQYRPPSPGSSAWSIIAKNIRVGLLVPADRPLPNWVLARMLASTGDPNQLIDQYIVLQGVGDRLFGGGGDPSFPIPLTIEASSDGQEHSYNQRFEFVSFYGSSNLSFDDTVMFERASNAETLIDPINHTPRFQVNMFQASAYPRVAFESWPTIN